MLHVDIAYSKRIYTLTNIKRCSINPYS